MRAFSWQPIGFVTNQLLGLSPREQPSRNSQLGRRFDPKLARLELECSLLIRKMCRDDGGTPCRHAFTGIKRQGRF